jgi:hypothetical protein
MTEGTDSASGGFLQPQQSALLEDDALDDFLQMLVAGITGLPGAMVRPRWQTQEPILPPIDTDWSAIGIVSRDGDTYSTEWHEGGGPTSDIGNYEIGASPIGGALSPGASGPASSSIIRHETLNIVATFYGPNCQGNAALLRDGLGLAQNREVLFLARMGLQEIGQLARGPELVKGNWLGRVDLPFSIRRAIVRNYAILNLRQLQGTLATDAEASVALTTPAA